MLNETFYVIFKHRVVVELSKDYIELSSNKHRPKTRLYRGFSV